MLHQPRVLQRCGQEPNHLLLPLLLHVQAVAEVTHHLPALRLLLAQADNFRHQHVFVPLQLLNLCLQPIGDPILPNLDDRLAVLPGILPAATSALAGATAAAGGGAARGLAAVDFAQQVAAPPQEVFVGKLPAIGVDLAEALQAGWGGGVEERGR